MDRLDEFTEALGADVVIPGVAKPGPLPVTEMLALRSWFDRRQRRLRAEQ